MRFLRARQPDEKKAATMYGNSIQWKRDNNVASIVQQLAIKALSLKYFRYCSSLSSSLLTSSYSLAVQLFAATEVPTTNCPESGAAAMPIGDLNLFGLHQFDYKDSFFSGQTILSEGAGYLIVVGFGALFVVLTMTITFLDQKYGGAKNTSEGFNTAGRSIKTGLVAVDAVSRWTWVSTILIAPSETYLYGISGAFWYGSGTVLTLFLFGIFALELKRKAPNGHTVIELVHLRWGKFASFVFLYLCYINNFAVSILLFIGAGTILSAVTGMNIYASLVLIPLGVVIYTFTGGLKATFTSSYIHTIVIFFAVNIFTYKVYASDQEAIGSINKVWTNLNLSATVIPVKGNKGGSYLTMFSKGGTEFGIWNLFAAFGVLFADQAYWQGAFAAAPKAAFNGYILGGVLAFAIPFTYATAMGLSAQALDLPISMDEFNQGLTPVAVAQYLMGKGGVVLILTIIFMAATSSGSAEFMSMSSLWTYDVYKRYINPAATEKQLLRVSRASVAFFGMFMAGLSCLCKLIDLDVNFLFFVGGLVVTSTVAPLAFMIIWRAVPAGAAIASALGGQVIAIATWLAHTQIVYGRMTIDDTLIRVGPSLDGALVAFFGSMLICVLWTLVAPEKGDTFARWQNIETDVVQVPDTLTDELKHQHVLFNKYSLFAIFITVVFVVLWPILTLPAGVWSKGYFTFWVVLSMIWATIGLVVAAFLPLVEARSELMRIGKRSLGLEVGKLGSPIPSVSRPLT